jgi:hypothetical protein
MKQRLKPIVVPWMVSPSVPQLRLSVHDADKSAAVQFFAHFALRAGWTKSQLIGFPHVDLVRNPGEQSANDPAYGLVRMAFEAVAWAQTSPAHSDREVLNRAEFDTSAIPYSSPSSDVGAWLRDFQSLWLKSGNCPDPRAYRVEFSGRLADLNLRGYEHILIAGRDEYVEVIARRWRWDESTPQGGQGHVTRLK